VTLEFFSSCKAFVAIAGHCPRCPFGCSTVLITHHCSGIACS
jgi:hypothetical protein